MACYLVVRMQHSIDKVVHSITDTLMTFSIRRHTKSYVKNKALYLRLLWIIATLIAQNSLFRTERYRSLEDTSNCRSLLFIAQHSQAMRIEPFRRPENPWVIGNLGFTRKRIVAFFSPFYIGLKDDSCVIQEVDILPRKVPKADYVQTVLRFISMQFKINSYIFCNYLSNNYSVAHRAVSHVHCSKSKRISIQLYVFYIYVCYVMRLCQLCQL